MRASGLGIFTLGAAGFLLLKSMEGDYYRLPGTIRAAVSGRERARRDLLEIGGWIALGVAGTGLVLALLPRSR